MDPALHKLLLEARDELLQAERDAETLAQLRPMLHALELRARRGGAERARVLREIHELTGSTDPDLTPVEGAIRRATPPPFPKRTPQPGSVSGVRATKTDPHIQAWYADPPEAEKK